MQEAINEQNEITAERARISNEREELEARLNVPFHPDLQTRTQEAEPVQEPTRSAKERLEAAQQAYRQRIQEQAQANQDTGAQMHSAKERLEAAQQAYRQQVQAHQEQLAEENPSKELYQELDNELFKLKMREREIENESKADTRSIYEEGYREDLRLRYKELEDIAEKKRELIAKEAEILMQNEYVRTSFSEEERSLYDSLKAAEQENNEAWDELKKFPPFSEDPRKGAVSERAINAMHNLAEIKKEWVQVANDLMERFAQTQDSPNLVQSQPQDTQVQLQSQAQFEPQSQAQSQAQTQDTQVQQNADEIPATFDEYKAQFQDVIDSREMTEGQLLDEYNAVRRRNERLQRRGEPIRRTRIEPQYTDPGLRDSLGSARAGFDPYSQAMNRYGTIEPGENPARLVDVPQSMTGSDRVRKTARTFMEAEATSDELVEAFQEGVTQGEWSYTPKKDKDSVERSMRVLSGENGIQKGFTQWGEVVEGNRQVTKDDIVLAEMLYKMASRNGDTATAKKLAAEIAAFGTTAGQNVQAIRLLKKATPEGKLFYVQKVTDKLNADMQKRFKGEFEDIDIPDELAQKLLDAEGQEEMDAATDEIYDYVADRVPKTADMRLDAWRYFAMLGNPRTHVRNVVGNFVMQGLTRSRNATSAALQQFIVKDADQRTRTFAGSMEAHKFAKQDFLANKDLLSGNPYTTSESGIIWQKVREKAFTVDANKREKSAFWRAVNDLMKVPQTLSSANTKSLDFEDFLFKRSTYIDSLANFLTARGYKTDFENIPANVMEEARGHAIDDALEATFQEYSALASKLAQFESGNKAAKLLVGGTFPFKRVPINIAKQGIRYSPAGLLNSMTAGIKKLRNGDITAAEFCDELASGLTGTGVAALGAFLISRGILSAGGDDDDKQAGFDAAMGSQNYAINFTIGGQKYSYTIDWAAPSVVPLFIGAEFYKALKQRDEETSLSKATLDALGRMFEPMMQMTMLSGVSSTIKSAAYSQQDPIYGVLGNVASNYAGQFVPTLLGQIARTMDPVRRSTFYDANSKVPKELQRFLQRQGAKIPGLSEKMPEYLDVWGRNDMGSDNMLLRVVENFLSPGYANKVGSTKVEDELQRLNDAGYEGMLPGAVQKSGKLDGNRMTAEQWMKRQKEQGNTAYEIMQNFIGTQEYQNLTDDQKAKFIDKAYEYAKNSGKAAAGGDTSDFAKWYEAANNAQSEAGLSKERFLSLYAYKSAIEDEAPDEAKASLKQGMWEEYINGLSDLSQEQKDYVLDNVKFWQMMPADSGAYQKAKNAGYDTPEAIQALLEAKSSFSTDGNNDINNTEMYNGIIGQTSDPAEQEKMYNAIKDKDAKKSWKELAAEQSKQQQTESAAQAALDKAVSKDKQTAFAAALENAAGTKQTDCYRALTSTGASEAECKAYFAYISAQKGWKKSWEKVKADALKGK